MEKPTISIIGLGKLGSSMVAAFASKSHKVIGVDIDSEKVRLMNEAKPPVFEPHLAEYLENNKERISAVQDYESAILNSEITFVILPTPSNEKGGFSNKYLIECAKEIGKNLAKKSSYHLVVFRSTVIPGSHQEEILPILEQYSGKKCGPDFGFCLNPEFVALGTVIKNILFPDFVLIGEADSVSGGNLEKFYQGICGPEALIKRMNIVNAEITKIALNTYVTTKISFSNMLAELCEKIPGANIDVITDTLGNDKRIGHKYLKGALGYAGPCFYRDNKALIFTGQKFGLASMPLAKVTDEINDHQIGRVVEKVLSYLPEKGKVAVLGLTYKPDTNFVEPSQALEIAKNLAEKGISVNVYDPAGMENAKKILGSKVVFALSSKECILKADVILIATQWSEFENIQPADLKSQNGEVVIIDCWRILNPDDFKDIAKYIPLGVNIEKNNLTKVENLKKVWRNSL